MLERMFFILLQLVDLDFCCWETWMTLLVLMEIVLNVITLAESLLAVGQMPAQGKFTSNPCKVDQQWKLSQPQGAWWKCFRGFLGVGKSGARAVPLSSSTEIFHIDLLQCQTPFEKKCFTGRESKFIYKKSPDQFTKKNFESLRSDLPKVAQLINTKAVD